MKPRLRTVSITDRLCAIIPLDDHDALREALEDAAATDAMRRSLADPDEEAIPPALAGRIVQRRKPRADPAWAPGHEGRQTRRRRRHFTLLSVRYRERRQAGLHCRSAPYRRHPRPPARRLGLISEGGWGQVEQRHRPPPNRRRHPRPAGRADKRMPPSTTRRRLVLPDGSPYPHEIAHTIARTPGTLMNREWIGSSKGNRHTAGIPRWAECPGLAAADRRACETAARRRAHAQVPSGLPIRGSGLPGRLASL